jgi:hypothetical protein
MAGVRHSLSTFTVRVRVLRPAVNKTHRRLAPKRPDAMGNADVSLACAAVDTRIRIATGTICARCSGPVCLWVLSLTSAWDQLPYRSGRSFSRVSP